MNKFQHFEATVIPEHHPLFKGLLWVSAAISKDEERFVLNHFLVERDGLKWIAVATDGKRMHVHTFDPGMFDTDISVIDAGLYQVIFKSAKLIAIAPPDSELNYPNWRGIMPDFEPTHSDAIQARTVGKMGIRTGILLATDYAAQACGFGCGRKADETVLVEYGGPRDPGGKRPMLIRHDLGEAVVMELDMGDTKSEDEKKTDEESTPFIPALDPKAPLNPAQKAAAAFVEMAKKAGGSVEVTAGDVGVRIADGKVTPIKTSRKKGKS